MQAKQATAVEMHGLSQQLLEAELLLARMHEDNDSGTRCACSRVCVYVCVRVCSNMWVVYLAQTKAHIELSLPL
jgi:hypothetical protein